MTMRDKVGSLLDAGLDILHDLCPRDEDVHLCNLAEDYDDDICTRCWSDYLFRIANMNGGINHA